MAVKRIMQRVIPYKYTCKEYERQIKQAQHKIDTYQKTCEGLIIKNQELFKKNAHLQFVNEKLQMKQKLLEDEISTIRKDHILSGLDEEEEEAINKEYYKATLAGEQWNLW